MQPLQPERDWSLVTFETLPVTVSLTTTRTRTDDGGDLAMQFERTATADHPAALGGTFTNANDYENTFELRRVPLFSSLSARPGGKYGDGYTYRDDLLLAPTENHDLTRNVPDWRPGDDGRWRLARRGNGPGLPDRHRMDAGETIRFEYALLGMPEGQGFPRERYHFRGHHGRDVVFDVWSTDQPGPTETSLLADADPDPLPDAERMAWYHDVDAVTTVYLSPDIERGELPVSATFTLVNHGREQLSGNPVFWRLWKHVDGRWFHVAPTEWPMPGTRVPPGGFERWSLKAFGGHTIHCEGGHAVGHLGGGRYSFEVDIGRDERTHAALLDLQGPPATLEPADGLEVTRDGSDVRVEWPRREDEVQRAALTLTRTEEADTRLITEQVMQRPNRALRNTLPFLDEDVEAVVLITDRHTVSRGARTRGNEDGRFRFHYREAAYEVTADFEA